MPNSVHQNKFGPIQAINKVSSPNVPRKPFWGPNMATSNFDFEVKDIPGLEGTHL